MRTFPGLPHHLLVITQSQPRHYTWQSLQQHNECLSPVMCHNNNSDWSRSHMTLSNWLTMFHVSRMMLCWDHYKWLGSLVTREGLTQDPAPEREVTYAVSRVSRVWQSSAPGATRLQTRPGKISYQQKIFRWHISLENFQQKTRYTREDKMIAEMQKIYEIPNSISWCVLTALQDNLQLHYRSFRGSYRTN